MGESWASESNPFCTRFTQPGAMPFQFDVSSAIVPGCRPESKVSEIVEKLYQSRFGQIVGPHGTGKSTLLSTLGPTLSDRFPQITHLQLQASESNGFFQSIHHASEHSKQVRQTAVKLPAGSLLVIDGIEQIARVDRWWLRRHALRNQHWLLATSHKTLTGFANLYTTRVSRRLVEYLCRHLLRDATERTVALVCGELDQVAIHDRTDVRSLWFDLYDVVSTRA